MGLVYACRHRELAGHLVAIKVLFPEVAQDKVAAARFRNEIFASYGVSHPNVVRAYEYIRDGDLVAYTMEYVGGGDLADRLSKPGKFMPIDEVVRLLGQMSSGVQAIHDAGIVHRDLKPENILLTTDGQVKIADFGIARTGHGPKLTEHGGVVGTIDYVSPEYMLNSHVDWRSDIYALGILAYEMIAGESPFRGDSVYATMTKRLKQDAAPPSSLRPECPPALDRIILKAMQRDPEQRYQSAAEMYYDLQALNPQPATTSAAVQISRPQATKYVGPSVATPGASGDANAPVDSGAVSAEPTPPPAAQHAPEPQVTTSASGAAASSAARSSTSMARPSGAPRPDLLRPTVIKSGRTAPVPGMVSTPAGTKDVRKPDPYEGTQVINPEVFDIASAFDDGSANEPVKMERILSRRNGFSGEWNRQALSQANVVKSGIDDKRMRTLSQVVDRRVRPVWIDLVLVVFMVVVGIGVGFAILSILLPEVFNPSSKEAVQGAQSMEMRFETRSALSNGKPYFIVIEGTKSLV